MTELWKAAGCSTEGAMSHCSDGLEKSLRYEKTEANGTRG